MDILLNRPKSATWYLRSILLIFWPLLIFTYIFESRIGSESWSPIAFAIFFIPIFLYIHACFSIVPNILFYDDLHFKKFANTSDLNWLLFHSQPKLIILHPSYYFFAFFTGGIFSSLLYFIKIDPILNSMIKKNDQQTEF